MAVWHSAVTRKTSEIKGEEFFCITFGPKETNIYVFSPHHIFSEYLNYC
jgi:hypothetical protein